MTLYSMPSCRQYNIILLFVATQTLLDAPDLPGYQPALPRGLDIDKLASEVEAEAKQKKQK